MTPLVGRVDETEAITRLLTETAAGAPAALVIEGEAGIGKTTLWLAALDRARQQGIRVLTARAASAESVLAYAALADLLGSVDPELWADLPAPQRQGLDAALLRAQNTATPTIDQRAVGAALLGVLTRLAFQSPLLVCIDDLHWLDGSSAGAIAFAARRLGTGVGILCTARSDTDTSTGWLQLSQPGAVHRIRLPHLTFGEMHDVLVAQGGGPITRSLLQRIHRVSGGNPFYAVELVRAIEHRTADTELVLPESLNELAQARINSVGPGAEDALLAIASLAAPDIPLIARALEVGPEKLVRILEAAELQGVVALDGRRVDFTHPLLAHAVYLGAAPPRRREMHRRLAEAVTEPELHARHLALSDPTGHAETLAALDGAADIARARGAPAAAAELLELAIKLGGPSSPRRMRLAQCRFDCGETRSARQVLEQVCADLPAGPMRAEALQMLVLVRVYDDSLPDAAELGRRALADCREQSALRVEILTVLAFTELNIGRIEAAVAPVDEAVTIAEQLELSEPLGRALGMRSMIGFMSGDGVADADLQRAVALEDPEARTPLPFRPSVQATLMQGWSGEFDSARDTLTEIGRRSLAAGEEGEILFIAFHLVTFDLWRGDLPQAAATADDAMRRAHEFGGGASMFLALSAQGAVAAHRGQIEEARRHLAAALTAGQDSGFVFMLSAVVATQGFLEMSLGDHERALAALRPLLPMTERMPRFSEIIACRYLPDAVEAMTHLGRLEEAEPYIETLERNGARLDRAWMLAVGARCRAMLMAANGDVAGAAEHARLAVTLHGRVPMPIERARTLLLLGKLERRLRHQSVAHAVLTEALGIFDAVGAQLWVNQTRLELDRRGSKARGNSHLTPAEQRVADLAASGMSNHDIASALFVTRKTVEVNLSRIYRKLGIRSRTELYHVIHQRPGPANL